MEATQTARAASAAPELVPEVLARVRGLYDRGLYLQAFRAGEAAGPLADWGGAPGRILAGRLAAQLGAPGLARRLHLRAWREHRGADHTLEWAVRAIRTRVGPFAAAGFLRRETAGRPLSAEALALAGSLASDLRDFDEAERCLAEALALEPRSAWIQVERAMVLHEADAYDAALEAAETALALRPGYRPAIDVRAELLVLLGRDAEAIAFLSDAVTRLEAPSTLVALVDLLLEHERHEEADRHLDRLVELSPLAGRGHRAWVATRRSEVAYRRGDRAAAARLAREAGHPFYEKVADRLDAAPPGARRVLLPVAFVRQHHLTCAPATVSALARWFGVEAAHLEIAETICYDGTPDHAQRSWAEDQGFAVAEFTVTWGATRALVDRGVPFALTTIDPGNGHLQAVVGYDEARGTLLIRDPYHRTLSELAEPGLERYRPCGPRGMAMVPADRAALLAGLDVPEAALHDGYHRVQTALVAHDRAAAAAACRALAEAAPGHRLAHQAARALAGYDGDEEARLRATEALLAIDPDEVNLRLSRALSLADLGRLAERLAWLRAEVARAPHPLLALALAEAIRDDAREAPEALRLSRRVFTQAPRNANAYHVHGHVLWDVPDREEALRAYRAAACLEPTDERYAEAFFRATRFLGRAPEAIDLLRGRFERFGRKSGAPAVTLFEALDALERGKEAFEVLERALALRPRDGGLLLHAARAWNAVGDLARAEAFLARAEGAARPQELLRTRAWLAEGRGEPAEAARLWAALLDLEPLHGEALRARTRLLAETQDRAAAAAELSARAERFPHHLGLGRLLVEWMPPEPRQAVEAALDRLLAGSPHDPWTLRERALVSSRAGRHDEARGFLERAAAVDPTAPALHNVRAALLVEEGRVEAAKEELRAALRRSADETWPLRELLRLSADVEERRRHLAFAQGELARQVGFGDGLLAYQQVAAGALEPGELATSLRDAHAARPDLWHAWVALGRQLLLAGHGEEARALLGAASERFPLLPRVWIELAVAHRAVGDRAGQRAALERAVALAPAWVEPAVKLAELLHGAGEFEPERALLLRALARSPSDPILRGWLADASWALGRREEAVEELARALRLDPGYSWAWGAYRRFTSALGRREAPRALAEALVAERPRDGRAWLLAAHAREDLDGKLGALDRALELDLRDVAAREVKVDLLAEAGRHEEALAVARADVWHGPAPRGLRLRAARVELSRGRAAEARAALEALVAAEPDHVEAWEQLCDWNADAGRHAEALAAARQLVRLTPDHPVALGYLAQAHDATGNRAEAKTALARAVDLDPSYGWALRNLFRLRLEDREWDLAGETLAVVARHLPAVEARQHEVELAAARGDGAGALAAFGALLRADPAPERGGIQAALRALDGAGMGDAAGRALGDALGDGRAARAAGYAWGERAAERRSWLALFRARRTLLRHLAAAQPSPAALGAAEGWLEAAARRGSRLRVRDLLARAGQALAADVVAWGTAGFALSTVGAHRRCAAWFRGWRGRAGLEPWMLLNLALSLRDLGRLDEAGAASRAALDLPRDHTSGQHEVLAAADAALSLDFAPLDRVRAPADLATYYRYLLALASALRRAADPGPAKDRWLAVKPWLAEAVTVRPDAHRQPFLDRHRALATRALARALGGARWLARIGWRFRVAAALRAR